MAQPVRESLFNSFFIHLDKRCFWKRVLSSAVISSSGNTGGRGSKGNPGRWRVGDSGAHADSELGVSGRGWGPAWLFWVVVTGTRAWRLWLWAPACPEVLGFGFCFSLVFWTLFSLCSSVDACDLWWLFKGLCYHGAALVLPRRTHSRPLPMLCPRCQFLRAVSMPETHPLVWFLFFFFCGLFNKITNICIKL